MKYILFSFTMILGITRKKLCGTYELSNIFNRKITKKAL